MSANLNGKVLVFDSGMGGLTVAREIQALAPFIAVDYAADSGFFPYGEKSDIALKQRLPEVAKALCQVARPDVFVIACNTASTLALSEVRSVLDIPVIGTVPAIKPAAQLTRTGTIGLLATPGTVRRNYTAELIEDFASGVRVILHGSIALVRMAEQVASGHPVPLESFRIAQAPLFEAEGGDDIDTVVLACTHFPLIRGELAATIPQAVNFVDSGEAIARQTMRVLAEMKTTKQTGGYAWITSPVNGQTRLADVCGRFGYADVQQVAV